MAVVVGCAHAPEPSQIIPSELVPAELVEKDLLPDEIHGWQTIGEDSVYDADALFDYINGGAELYRAFNVKRVIARPFEKEGAPDIYADVYDMGSAEDAYGVYHHEPRSAESAGIGQESEYTKGSLAFWKDRYFVSIMALKETEESKTALLALGKSIAAAIRGEGAPPALPGLLPEEGLMAERVRFFHTHTILNTHFFLKDDNVLGLGQDTDAVLARYAPAEEGGAPNTLLLVQYPSAASAKTALDEFLKACLPGADADGTAKKGDERWGGARVTGTLLSAVLDAPSKEVVAAMLDQAARAAGK